MPVTCVGNICIVYGPAPGRILRIPDLILPVTCVGMQALDQHLVRYLEYLIVPKMHYVDMFQVPNLILPVTCIGKLHSVLVEY